MNRDGVDLELTRSSYHPRVGIAALVGSPEPLRRTCENQSGHGRMLQDGACAARLRRNALNLTPALTACLALVDTAAGRSNNVIWIAWIDIDREDVGVVNDSVLDRIPGLPTVN